MAGHAWALQQGWRALARDLGGHGRSTAYRLYLIGRHCRGLTRLLDPLAVPTPILCCPSYGVPFGLEWAARQTAARRVLNAVGSHALDPWCDSSLMTLKASGAP